MCVIKIYVLLHNIKTPLVGSLYVLFDPESLLQQRFAGSILVISSIVYSDRSFDPIFRVVSD